MKKIQNEEITKNKYNSFIDKIKIKRNYKMNSKSSIITFIILIIFNFTNKINTLYFDLHQYKETCFTDEFVEKSVAIIQYKVMDHYDTVYDTDGGYFHFTIQSLDLVGSDEEYNNLNESKNKKMRLDNLTGTELNGKLYYIIPNTNIYMICVKGNKNSFLYRQENSIKFVESFS